MTTALNCRIAFVNEGLQTNGPDLGDIENFLRAQFSAATNGDIDLQFGQRITVQNPRDASTPVSALDLHRWLIEVNQNPPLGPVSTISVLVASSYSGLQAAFGVMFDRGFTTPDDNNPAPEFLACPRQGCAVFLDTITSHRSDRFEQEVWYTAAHELGHVFNLQHDPECEAVANCQNFMRTSNLTTTYGAEAFHFTPDDQRWLGQCSTNVEVRPGASIFGSTSAANIPDASRYRRRSDLRLHLELPQSEVFGFEPFQLEISLLVQHGDGKTISVPEHIDPASGVFRIFIENEARERRLYRSPLQTCGPAGKLQLAVQSPFRRDFPIFGEAGGYTFSHPGRYRIWAELDTRWRRLTSNTVELRVRSNTELSKGLAEAKALLTSPRIASLLFHREDWPGLSATRKLARLVREFPNAPSTGQLNYTLGRVLLRQAQRGAPHPAELPHAQAYFESALALGGLGEHAKKRAEAHLSA